MIESVEEKCNEENTCGHFIQQTVWSAAAAAGGGHRPLEKTEWDQQHQATDGHHGVGVEGQ